MPENSLKIIRNVRGGVLRIIRVVAASALLWEGSHLLMRMVDRSSPHFNPSLSPIVAAGNGALAGAAILLSLYWLRGTLVRAAGVLLSLLMMPFVIIGHLFTLIGLPDRLRRMAVAIMLVGFTIIYTGQGEWTVISFAHRSFRGQTTTA
jgi:hypothetical protein